MAVGLERPQTKAPPTAAPATQEAAASKTILLRVFRHSPSVADDAPRIVTYRVPRTRGMTVLDALLWVKENVDPGLAFRYSCRMGICGSCGMLINGKPELGCETQVADLGTDAIEVAPLVHFPVVRDVATDFTDFFSHHRRVMPYLIHRGNGDLAPVERELRQSEEQKLEYYQFTMCIMCGLCDAACPIVGMDKLYAGPQALAQAYRFAVDSRDEGWRERIDVVDDPHGCWRCELAGSCSAVCPKGVDPALGIQLLKRMILRRRVRRT